MRSTSYAASWSDGGGRPLAGAIDIGPSGLTLKGAGRGRQASRRVAYGDILSLRLGRSRRERVCERTALMLELAGDRTIRIAVHEVGALHELVEALTAVNSMEVTS